MKRRWVASAIATAALALSACAPTQGGGESATPDPTPDPTPEERSQPSQAATPEPMEETPEPTTAPSYDFDY